LRIVQVHDRITRRVDSALHRQHGLSLTGFEALRRIAEAPGERATMGQVAEALGLSRPGVTSTIARLVADGLVLRERGGGDRRLMHARLTPAGSGSRMRPPHTTTSWRTCSACSGTTPRWSRTRSPGSPQPPGLVTEPMSATADSDGPTTSSP
jgi:DNA-binding transcriptional ArsR family regulator